jgi:hypothetical protein
VKSLLSVVAVRVALPAQEAVAVAVVFYMMLMHF